MKIPIFFRLFQAAVWMVGMTGAGLAAEVVGSSNLFPSPSGLYRNESAANVIYGATVQLAATECREADRSIAPPAGTSPATVVTCLTTHFRIGGGAGTPPVFAVVPVDATLRLTPNAMGTPGAYDIEVLGFTATGLPGGLMIRESPTLQSTGQHSLHKVASGNWYANSFFDVFTEVSADGGATWEPGGAAMHFDLTEPELVVSTGSSCPTPAGNQAASSILSYPGGVMVKDLQLAVSPGYVTQLPLSGSLHQTTERGRASGRISTDGGTTYAPFACDYTAFKKYQAKSKTSEARLSAGYVLDGEIVSFALTGGTLPGGMKLRESPTKASTGRTSMRLATDGMYRISSFFDIFTEVSLDNGATWSPNEGEPCYIVNSHGTPGVEVAALAFNPAEVVSSSLRVSPTPQVPLLMHHFKNGDIPNQEDLIEYPDGTILRGIDLRLPSTAIAPPAPGTPEQTQSLDITLQCELSSDGGVTFEPVRGTASGSVRLSPLTAAAPFTACDVEWLSLDFSTTLNSGGTLLLRESPTLQSKGKTTLRLASDGNWLVHSFFDIFTEISYDGGATWKTGPLKWMAPEAIGRERIRPSADYPPADTPLLADDDMVFPNGAVLRRVIIHGIHNGSNLPPPSSSKNFTIATTASGEISTDGGETFRHWSGQCDATVLLTSHSDYSAGTTGGTDCRFFTSELLQLDLSGGGLGTLRVRESPTKASLGRTSVRTTPSTSFGSLSFFDVFTEFSSDGGVTWEPARGLPVTFAFDNSPGAHFYPTASLPPASVLEMPADEMMDLGSGQRVRKMIVWLESSAARVSPPPPGQSAQLKLDGMMDCEVSTDGGVTYVPVRAPLECDVTVTAQGAKRSEAEMTIGGIVLACDLNVGGTVVKIRESPSLPSRGKVRLRPNLAPPTPRESPTRQSLRASAGGFLMEGFFDVFVETSADGLIWSPRSNLLRLGFAPVADLDNSFATNAFPPRDGVMETETAAPPVSYGTGPVIRDMTIGNFEKSWPLSGSSTHVISCTCTCDASTDGGTTWSEQTATAELTVASSPIGTTGAFDHEVLALVVTLPNGMRLRESPTLQSTGKISVRSRPLGTVRSLHVIDSFFDIFTEVSSDSGTTWIPASGASRLILHRVPLEVACNTDWQPMPNQRISGDPDFDLGFVGTDATISGVTLDTIGITPSNEPPPAPGAKTKRQCMFNLGLKGRTAATAPPESHRMKVEAGWECMEITSSTDERVLQQEITSLNVCGGTLPSGMMLRESPTRASLGRTSIRTVPGGYRVNSFFDVFLELSLDGGQTWHEANTPLCLETLDASPEVALQPSKDPLPPLFTSAPRSRLTRFFETGDKPTQAQFHALLDSTVNFVDDREMIGLRSYDATIDYQIGDTSVVRRDRGTLSFGWILWEDPKLDSNRSTYDMEVTTFDMQGGTMPAGMKVRESPTRPSTGATKRTMQADGTYLVSSFFDVFLEVSRDNGGTWEASDLPLHFVQQDRVFSSMTHSDQFVPQGINYIQSPTPIRCPDGTCASTICDFTTPPAPLPATPGVPQTYPLAGHFAASFTSNGGAPATVSADLSASVSVTLAETSGGTRYFDTEMTGFDLTGTITPAPFRIRESPTKASLGRHTVTDVGGGDFRVSSFFDIWTEISVDGGQTWSACDVPLRLDLSGPEISVRMEPDIELANGSSTVDFGVLLAGGTATRNVLISNHGTAVLSDFGLSITGSHAMDFIHTAPSTTVIPPGATVAVPVMLQSSGTGIRTATLHIASNDGDANPFDVSLTARVLSPTGDDDGDGLTNAQEVAIHGNPLYTSPTNGGFNPLHGDNDRLAFFRDNGLYLATDMRALAMGRPVLQRDAVTGNFVLRVGVLQSSTLAPPWTPLLGINPTYNPATGQVDLEFAPPVGAPAQFYQVFGTEP